MTPYLQGALDPREAIVSAVNADPRCFPPMIVATGGDEMFHDAIVKFTKRLTDAGVRVSLFDEPDMFHVYMVLMPWMRASQRLYDAIAEVFRYYRGEGKLTRADPASARDWQQRHGVQRE